LVLAAHNPVKGLLTLKTPSQVAATVSFLGPAASWMISNMTCPVPENCTMKTIANIAAVGLVAVHGVGEQGQKERTRIALQGLAVVLGLETV